MKHHLPVIESHAFEDDDFVGGDAAIDFVNTVTARDADPRDWLDGYPRLLEWAAKAELLPKERLRALARSAESDPSAARRALARAKELREALFEILAAIADERIPPKESLALLRSHWLEGAKAHEFRPTRGGVAAELAADATDLDLIAALVAWRMVEHVLPTPADRLKICQGPECSWLFMDSSKAGRRRWCDMADCGNAAKARRHYARERART